ncbi:hypothetical protein REPUB_Repub13aG0051600 [Reevesia pubescens]
MAELEGGTILFVTFQFLLERMATGEVMDFIRGKKLDDRLLKKLEIMLLSLKDVVYDAEDLLDEIASKAARSKLESCEDQTSSTSKFMKHLDRQKDTLDLTQRTTDQKAFQRSLPPTSLMVDGFGVYGRDVDKEVIKKLLDPNNPIEYQIYVIPIVGMGGLGKTTLAQLIFNDKRVEDWFDLKAWVCIYDKEFDAFKVIQEILQEILVSYDKRETLNQLQLKLKEKLSRKKFLFVLDDV